MQSFSNDKDFKSRTVFYLLCYAASLQGPGLFYCNITLCVSVLHFQQQSIVYRCILYTLSKTPTNCKYARKEISHIETYFEVLKFHKNYRCTINKLYQSKVKLNLIYTFPFSKHTQYTCTVLAVSIPWWVFCTEPPCNSQHSACWRVSVVGWYWGWEVGAL